MRSKPLPALVLGAICLSAIGLWSEVPLREPGRFTLGVNALVDQLLVLLLTAAVILNVKPSAPSPTWPCSGELALIGRGVGMASAIGAAATLTLTAQYLMALMANDLLGEVPLEPPQRLDGLYAQLSLAIACYAIVLCAWAQFLRLALGPGLALLSLLVLVFGGFLLPRIAESGGPWALLIWPIPDLGNLAPVNITKSNPLPCLNLTAYAILHALMVWSLGAVVLRIARDRGRSIEVGDDEA